MPGDQANRKVGSQSESHECRPKIRWPASETERLHCSEREREREMVHMGAEVIRSTSQITFSNTYCSPFSLYARPVNSTAKPQLAIKTAETHVVKNWKSNFNIDGAAEAEPGRPHHADNVLPK